MATSDGWKSRKLWLTVLTQGLVLWGYILSGHPGNLYGQFCMALLSAAGLYKASSVYEKLKAPPAPPTVPAATP